VVMGVGYNPRIVTDGLVLCLDAANKRSYPGSGTTWTDRSANGYDGTLNNSPAITDKAITLSSTNDYIEIPSVIQASTIDFWFNNPVATTGPVIYAGQDIFNSNNWQWCLFYHNATLFWRHDSGSFGTSLNNFTSTNTWHHFVMTRSSTGKVYIDGNHVSSNTSTPPTVTGNVRIGKAASTYWNGSVGALKLYNRVLTAKEVLQNYEATKGRYA